MTRPILWFATASMLTTVVHELTHAVVAHGLGVRSTLFNYSVRLNLTEAQAATTARPIIAVAGPLCCLVLGVLCAVAFRRARGSAARLPLFYFSVFGISTFFGNMMSAAFVGDFSIAAVGLHVPMAARYAVSVCGLLTLAGVLFWAGRMLRQWAPRGVHPGLGVLGIVVAPVVIGTAAVILANLPAPGVVGARIAEAAFWLFAALGFVTKRNIIGAESNGEEMRLRWADAAIFILAVLVIRIMVGGIRFVPPSAS